MPSEPSLMFTKKVKPAQVKKLSGALPLDMFVALPTNIRLGLPSVPGTNTLGYLAPL
jgi:hypothetical protein